MKLVASVNSPYARKIRVMLAEKGLEHEFVEENVWSPETRVPDYNPLGKVPVLLVDSGEALFDSGVIAEYLDALAAPRFIPASGLERARVRRDESLGDGIVDAGSTIFLERKRDAARQDEGWMKRQRGKVDAALAALASGLGDKPWLRGEAITLGDIACGCALFWLEFRLAEIRWRENYPNLERWARQLETRPSFSATRPKA